MYNMQKILHKLYVQLLSVMLVIKKLVEDSNVIGLYILLRAGRGAVRARSSIRSSYIV